MPRMQLSKLLPLLLLLVGFLSPGSLYMSMVPECRGEIIANTTYIKGYEAEDALEQELLTLTNQHRIQQGLRPLVSDDALTRIARNHSLEMAQHGYISHQLAAGDLETRMHRAGYSYEIARENVARASTVSVAQSMMVNSSKHKTNMSASDVTRIGIGITRHPQSSGNYIYVTEIFAAPKKEYPTPVVQNMAVTKLTEFQCQNGIISVQSDPLLNNLASRSVSSLNYPVKRDELRRLLADSADELVKKGRTDLSRLEVAVQLLHNPGNFKIPDQAREKKAGMFGTAVRQITDSKNQASFLVLTLIGFTR